MSEKLEVMLYGSRYRRIAEGLTLWGGIWEIKVKGGWRKVRNTFIRQKLNELAKTRPENGQLFLGEEP